MQTQVNLEIELPRGRLVIRIHLYPHVFCKETILSQKRTSWDRRLSPFMSAQGPFLNTEILASFRYWSSVADSGERRSAIRDRSDQADRQW
jgi:hypothetical protein